MSHGTLLLACCVSILTTADDSKDKEFVYVDLQKKANDNLSNDYGIPGNTRLCYPQGEQTLEHVKFKIEKGFVQLGSTLVRDYPLKVESIKVEQQFSKLHILHATGYGGLEEGNAGHVPDGKLIGLYKLHYEDGAEEGIPIVYGEDVRDWWNWDGSKPVNGGKVAWTGTNDAAKRLGLQLRLYLTSWENPNPERKVASIDYISTGKTAAAPFCIAITVERNKK
jgi:hypothetical protein